jgi:hypothetical protein
MNRGREPKLTLAELAVDLATQDVEKVGRRGHVGDLHIAVLVLTVQLVLSGELARLLVAKLQPALHSTRRVLRTLAIITVRQRDNETGALQPLGLSRSDKLVDNALSVIGEVTELGLPHDQGIRGGQRVAVFETEA